MRSLRHIAAAVLLPVLAFGASGTWNANSSGFWSDTTKWSPAAVPGTGPGDVVSIAFGISGSTKIITNDVVGGVILGTMVIGDTSSTYQSFTVANSGSSMLFTNAGAAPVYIKKQVSTAGDTISSPFTIGGDLVVSNTAASGSLTLSGAISDGGSARNLWMRSSSGPVILSGSNTASGTNIIDGVGNLQFNSDGALFTGPVLFNASGVLAWGANNLTMTRNIIIPAGITGTISGNVASPIASGSITGDGAIVIGTSAGNPVLFNCTGYFGITNTIQIGRSVSTDISQFGFTNLPDTVGCGDITIGTTAQKKVFRYNGAPDFSLNNRKFHFAGVGGQTLSFQADTGAGITTINTPITNWVGNQTIDFAGTSVKTNQHLAALSNSVGTLAITKNGTGTWLIGGTNNASTIAIALAGGKLICNGNYTLPTNGISLLSGNNANNQDSINILSDVDVSLPNCDITTENRNNVAGTTMPFLFGNTSADNGGISGGTATGRTLNFGAWKFVSTSATPLNPNGANPLWITNSYVLHMNKPCTIGPAIANSPAITTNQFKPTGGGIVCLCSGVQLLPGSTLKAKSHVLSLDGDTLGNAVQGPIMDATDLGSNTNANPLAVVKNGAGQWWLYSTNGYSGATTINGGVLYGVTGGHSSNSAVTVVNVSGAAMGLRITNNALTWACSNLTLAGANSALDFDWETAAASNAAPLTVYNGFTITAGTPLFTLGPTNAPYGKTVPVVNVVGGSAPTTWTPTPTGGFTTGTTVWVGNTMYLTLPALPATNAPSYSTWYMFKKRQLMGQL